MPYGASIAINNKHFLFNMPYGKAYTKVKYDVNDNDACESDDSRSDDNDEEYTKEELMDILEQVHTCFEMNRRECKELCKKDKSLE
jgi:hypothetical protein